ncbi:MAG TPA: GMC oxidoreductase [Kofleriaceae bacterium]|nr:GMC oxidoreductase [Kofleriaceae bacterium]
MARLLLIAGGLAALVSLASCASEEDGGPSCVGAKCDDLGTEGDEAFDYIVVGSGAGGGPLASRLARSGARVLLLEAGADAGDKLSYQVPAFHGMATEDPDLAWWYFVQHYGDPARAAKDSKITGEGILYPRGGTLGGSTAVNAMITVLPKNSDWNGIAALTGDDSWRAENMGRYFGRVSEWLSVERPDGKLALGDLRLLGLVMGAAKEFVDSGHDGPSFNPFDILGNAKQILGVLNRDINDAIAGDEGEGLFSFPLATRQRKRNGTRERILSTVADGHPLTVRTHALVTRVLFEESGDGGPPRAVGVEFLEGGDLYQADMDRTGEAAPAPRQVFAAREVILSAGAFNTPQLLKLSGVGPRAELEGLGIPVLVDAPGVGTNLQDRYEVGVVFDSARDIAILEDCTFGEGADPCLDAWNDGSGAYTSNGGVVSVLMKSDASRPESDLHMFAVPGSFKGYYPGYSVDAVADRSLVTWVILKGHTENRGGTVTLRSADPTERPDVKFHYFDDGDVDEGQDVNDLTAVVNAVEWVRRAGRDTDKLPLFGTFREVWPGSETDTRAEIAEWVKDEAWGHHASCSAPIGPDGDPMAVLDSRFRVRGVAGLRVVDASVFPRIPGTFIVLPIYMVSEKAADVILDDAGG